MPDARPRPSPAWWFIRASRRLATRDRAYTNEICRFRGATAVERGIDRIAASKPGMIPRMGTGTPRGGIQSFAQRDQSSRGEREDVFSGARKTVALTQKLLA